MDNTGQYEKKRNNVDKMEQFRKYEKIWIALKHFRRNGDNMYGMETI